MLQKLLLAWRDWIVVVIMDINYLLRPSEDTAFEYPDDDGPDWIDEALARGEAYIT